MIFIIEESLWKKLKNSYQWLEFIIIIIADSYNYGETILVQSLVTSNIGSYNWL